MRTMGTKDASTQVQGAAVCGYRQAAPIDQLRHGAAIALCRPRQAPRLGRGRRHRAPETPGLIHPQPAAAMASDVVPATPI